MNKLTYDSWLDATVSLFEETEEGAKALEWLETEDFLEAFEEGLNPQQTCDKFTNGYYF